MKEHFSYSQLKQYETCPYAYFLSKYCSIKPVPNGFSQCGSLMHECLADWAKGKQTVEALPYLFKAEFPKKVTAPFPRYLGPGYRDKLFRQCMDYLEGFTGFSDYEIIAAEDEIETTIAGEKFVGVIDLLVQDKYGYVYLIDHKSSSKVTKDMYRQLYLYSKLVTEKYGKQPTILMFNQFKTQDVSLEPFSEEAYSETIAWAEKVIGEIKNAGFEEWTTTNYQQFYCTELCECREECKKDAERQNAA